MSEQIVSVDQEVIKGELWELVKTTVEQTINALLNEEADELVGAERYERTASRDACRSGHYSQALKAETSGWLYVDTMAGCVDVVSRTCGLLDTVFYLG